jgi:ABC-2 type transport system permease protein
VSPYLAAFRIRLASRLQYRAAALAGMATQVFWGFLVIMVFLAFYRSDPAASTMTPSQMASYVWLQQAFLTFVMLWFRDAELFELITSGNVAYELCRPRSVYATWYAKLAAQRVAAAALRCPPILALAAFLPEPYRLSPPDGLAAFALFVAAISLGLLVQVALSMFIYILTFVTMQPYATTIFFATIGEFLAGMVIPIPFMPPWLGRIALALPFRLASDLPFRIWSGHIPIADALSGLVAQVAWIAALVALGVLCMSRILRRASINGG